MQPNVSAVMLHAKREKKDGIFRQRAVLLRLATNNDLSGKSLDTPHSVPGCSKANTAPLAKQSPKPMATPQVMEVSGSLQAACPTA
mmetsp:Transcript_39747/g.86766  ORF Transcript_39747/g.86766 Transcript_39747/m.86766 type:complete len:86 (-) Transcript_39747:95-352(-)